MMMTARVLHRRLGAALAAVVLAAIAPARTARAGKFGSTRQYKCVGQPITLTNSNTGAVQNGGTAPTFNTKGRAYCLLEIHTYHWNDGQGAAPGTVGLTVVSGTGGAGNTIGPFAATGSNGQGGVHNANWDVSVPQAPAPVVIKGKYSCLDSDPSTWAQNQQSNGLGFCTLVVQKAVKAKAPAPAKPTYACQGSQVTLFDNSNVFGVQNGGKQPFVFTVNRNYPGVFTWCLNSITTYHWNDGQGATPGKIGLRQALINLVAPNKFVPPTQATGSSGQGGALNVNWTVSFSTQQNPTIISGGYWCQDSSPKTWSQNQQSNGNGFCTIQATPAYVTNFTPPGGTPVPQPPPPTGNAPASSPPQGQVCSTNTYGLPIIYPHQVSPGGQASVLLACGTKTANSFTGALTPTGGAFTVPFGNCLNGVPPPSQPFITYGTGPGQVNPTACPNSIQAIPSSVDPNNPLALQITAPTQVGTYLVFVRTARGDLGTTGTLVVQ